VSSSKIEPQRAPSSFPEPTQPRPRQPVLISPKDQPARRRTQADTVSYDLEKWRALIKNDADVSRSVEALQPFGKKYVDQLAVAYLAFEEKSYLPTIVKLVADAIKKDSGRDPTRAAAMDGDPNTDLIRFAVSKARNSIEEQVFASPAHNNGSAQKYSIMSRAAPPQAESDARVQLAVQSELKTSHPKDGTGSSKRQPDARGVDEGPAVRVVAPARNATASLDDAKNLADLLNRIV
jgi:hypothetical protein